jgi:superfamily II DNA or RNA helicase
VRQERLADGIAFVARSLGLAAYVTPTMKTCTNTGSTNKYWRISISGDVADIPCKVKRRVAHARRQRKNVLNFGFEVRPEGVGRYHGFELEGPDGRFLLGDFTVTHNTIIFAELIKMYMKAYPGMFIDVVVHRNELVTQNIEKLLRVWPEGLLHVGMACFSAGKVDMDKPVTVGSVQTMTRRKRSHPCDLLIIDECFPAGTLVDGRPIETIRAGDRVESFNHGLGVIEEREVTRVFARETSALVAVRLRDGTRITCTPGHPLFTSGGYVGAGELATDEELTRKEVLTRRRGEEGVWWETVLGVEPLTRPGTAVHNLEVEGNSNYFAGGVLAHNCHHVPPVQDYDPRVGGFFELQKGTEYHGMIGGLLKANPRLRVLGVTATDFRMGHGYIYGTECRPGFRNLFPSLDYSITMNRLIADGFLSGWRAMQPVSIEKDLAGIGTNFAGDYETGARSEEMSREIHVRTAVEVYGKYGEGRRNVLVFAVDIAHAEKLAEAFRAAGHAAESVHSGMPLANRGAAIEDFGDGKIQFLMNVGILTEGWDCPKVDLIMMCRPTKSPGLFVQMFGRGTRLYEGKKDLLVLDLAGNLLRHGDPSEPDVIVGKAGNDREPPLKVCPGCHLIVPLSTRICEACGHEFSFGDQREEAGEAPEMAEYDKAAARRRKLYGLELTEYYSRANNRMLRLALYTDLKADVSYYLNFSETAHRYVVKKSRHAWRFFAGFDSEPPGSIEEALERREEIHSTAVEYVTPYRDENNYYRIEELG